MSELLKINVNEHTEKKNGLTYLSWAWAWAEVLKIDAQATWKLAGDHYPCHFFQDGTAMVTVEVTIKGHAKSAVLPVMDHRNKAIKNPDAFAINTAIMRCLAKAISMHGIGLYIYAGEDLPEGDTSLEDQLKASIELEKAKKNPTTDDLKAMDKNHSPRKLAWDALNSEWQEYIAHLAREVEACMPDSTKAQDRIDIEELEPEQLAALAYKLSSKTNAAVKTVSMERNGATA